MKDSVLTTTQLGQQLWVPFGCPQTILAPGGCQPLGTLQLKLPQVASLKWLTLHYVRMINSGVPTKLNPGLAAVYVGLYGSEGALIQVIPGQPLAYIGIDIPGVATLGPAFVPEIGEPDTYTLLLVNNMIDTDAIVTASGTWHINLS